MTSQKEIYFIRHGESVWNALGKHQGQEADIKLSKLGKKQSLLTGEYLCKFRNTPEFDCILCSPLIRAVKTAKYICKKYILIQKISLFCIN